MKMPRFLKAEAASLLIGLSLRPDVFKPMTSWPLPVQWTEAETEEFFMAFNMHHTKLDAEAVKRNQPLTSRAVNFKNVALFLSVLMLTELATEVQEESLDKLTKVLSLNFSVTPNSIVVNGKSGNQTPNSSSSGNDLGTSQ